VRSPKAALVKKVWIEKHFCKNKDIFLELGEYLILDRFCCCLLGLRSVIISDLKMEMAQWP